MEGVQQQDVKELDTLKEQDISAIIGMCCETVVLFFQLSDVCTFLFFLIYSQENRYKLEENREYCKPKDTLISVAMVSMLK